MSLPNHQAPKGRPLGVMKTNSQTNGPTDEAYVGKKNALLNFVEAKTYVIEVTDPQGVKKKPLTVMCIGDRWYIPPNAEVWTEQLQMVDEKHWLHKALAQRFSDSKAAATPQQDAVEVLGDGE